MPPSGAIELWREWVFFCSWCCRWWWVLLACCLPSLHLLLFCFVLFWWLCFFCKGFLAWFFIKQKNYGGAWILFYRVCIEIRPALWLQDFFLLFMSFGSDTMMGNPALYWKYFMFFCTHNYHVLHICFHVGAPKMLFLQGGYYDLPISAFFFLFFLFLNIF